MKTSNDRILEERRKYAEEMARKFYNNHKKEGTQPKPKPPSTKGSVSDTEDGKSATRNRSASIEARDRRVRHTYREIN